MGFLLLLSLLGGVPSGHATTQPEPSPAAKAPVVAKAPIVAKTPVVLRVLVYDSLMSKSGLGPELVRRFEAQCNCKLEMLPSGDGGQMIARLALDAERGKASAQVVIGLDQTHWARALPFLEPHELQHSLRIWAAPVRELFAVAPGSSEADRVVPFDYGPFSFIADTEALKKSKIELPKKLGDLLKPEWKRQIVLEDPRTSMPGLAFVGFTHEALGEYAWSGFWPGLRTQWLTLAGGWDAAYGLFLKGEAPLVWSYVTSQAYHAEHGDQAKRYRAVMLEEGAPIQIEGAALVRGAFAPGPQGDAQKEKARALLEFLVSLEFQEEVPQKNWMYPALEAAKLPTSFKELPKPTKIWKLRGDSAQWLKSWSAAIRAGQ